MDRRHRPMFMMALLFPCLAALTAAAQVYKCTDASGKTAYQSEPCIGGKTLERAPEKAAATPTTPRELETAFMKSAQCDRFSQEVERIQQFSSSRRTVDDAKKIDNFRRECLPLGYRFPDSGSAIEYNRTVSQKAHRDYLEQMQQLQEAREQEALRRRQAAAAKQREPTWERCSEISDQLHSMHRKGSTYKPENATGKIAEFRRDCPALGYEYPDTDANYEHNRRVSHGYLLKKGEQR